MEQTNKSSMPRSEDLDGKSKSVRNRPGDDNQAGIDCALDLGARPKTAINKKSKYRERSLESEQLSSANAAPAADPRSSQTFPGPSQSYGHACFKEIPLCNNQLLMNLSECYQALYIQQLEINRLQQSVLQNLKDSTVQRENSQSKVDHKRSGIKSAHPVINYKCERNISSEENPQNLELARKLSEKQHSDFLVSVVKEAAALKSDGLRQEAIRVIRELVREQSDSEEISQSTDQPPVSPTTEAKSRGPMQEKSQTKYNPQQQSQGPYSGQYPYCPSYRISTQAPVPPQQGQYPYCPSYGVSTQAPVPPQQGWPRNNRKYSLQSDQRDSRDNTKHGKGPPLPGQKMMAHGYGVSNKLSQQDSPSDANVKWLSRDIAHKIRSDILTLLPSIKKKTAQRGCSKIFTYYLTDCVFENLKRLLDSYSIKLQQQILLQMRSDIFKIFNSSPEQKFSEMNSSFLAKIEKVIADALKFSSGHKSNYEITMNIPLKCDLSSSSDEDNVSPELTQTKYNLYETGQSRPQRSVPYDSVSGAYADFPSRNMNNFTIGADDQSDDAAATQDERFLEFEDEEYPELPSPRGHRPAP